MHSYLIIELWILVVMQDNGISICGKNRARGFSVNTLQKKQTESPISVKASKHNAMEPHTEASVSPRPRPSPPGSHREPVHSKSFTVTPATTPDIAELGCVDASEYPVIKKKKCTSQLVDGKKSDAANHLEREHSETRSGKLTSLVLFAFLPRRSSQPDS